MSAVASVKHSFTDTVVRLGVLIRKIGGNYLALKMALSLSMKTPVPAHISGSMLPQYKALCVCSFVSFHLFCFVQKKFVATW